MRQSESEKCVRLANDDGLHGTDTLGGGDGGLRYCVIVGSVRAGIVTMPANWTFIDFGVLLMETFAIDSADF